jgi:hypothetical protein
MGFRDKPATAAPPPVSGQRYEYKAETIRSKLIGDKMDGSEVEKLLNARAREGWRLRSLTETEVKDGPPAGVRAPRHLTPTIHVRHRASSNSWEVTRPGQSAAPRLFRDQVAAVLYARSLLHASGGEVAVLADDGTELVRRAVAPRPPY